MLTQLFRSVFCSALLVFPAFVAAQAPFQSRVDLVAIDVCVRNRAGVSALDLGPDDFVVLEDGVPQKISFFAAEGHVPLAVSLLIDSSQSMAGVPLERARAAAVHLVEA